MPTAVPARSQHAAAVQRLSWPDTARFVILLLQIRWLNRRLEAAHRDVQRYGLDVAGPVLLYAARRWFDAQQAMSALLGTPELPEVAEIRTMMRSPTSLSRQDGARDL